ncbi:methyltransferase [Pyronema omphalodes]|nr:methyltransferase [Pyronema omphalodes]
MSTEENKVIEVDPAVLANELAEDYESSGYDTSTASLNSSINQYAYENGRRYHTYFGQDKNMLPTDETEQNRLDVHHEIFLLLLGRKLHLAPIGKNPQRILDVGTGTGIWAIDMADTYPSAEIIGVDLSPIQPHWVPPNCRFEVDDAEREWTFEPNSFDFIHIRNLAQGVQSWDTVLAQAWRCLKPGGWIELGEIETSPHSDDNSLPEDDGLRKFLILLQEGLEKMGRPGCVTVDFLRDNLKKTGFTDIESSTTKQTLAPWAKDPALKQVGALSLMVSEEGYHSYGMAVFTRVLGMTGEEADKVCSAVRTSVLNKNRHSYIPYHVVYGRKPEDAE